MHKRSIVVLGGSFNPPTIAHFHVMQSALSAVNGDLGFYVPVSFAYLKRKMAKLGQSHLSLPDELRLRMLQAMIEADPRMQIFKEHMHKPFSDDVGLMKVLQERYPDAEIFCIFGDDKLDLLDNFSRKHAFFEQYRCILFSRDSGNLMDAIGSHEHLADYRHAFVPVDALDGLERVSSTQIRKHLFDIDAAADMLHPAVVSILRELKQEDFPEEILQFKEEFAFLANEYPAKIDYEGVVYPCAASAFLAAGRADPAEKIKISRMNVDIAKMKYSRSMEEMQAQQQAAIMEEIVRLKFISHPELAEKLMETGDKRLVNGGKNKKTWGVNLITWEGENKLGVLLMKLRKELQEGLR